MLTVQNILICASYLCGVNLAAYAAFWIDKKAAQQGERRTPERTLLFLALIGGTLGSITAQHKLRHKTRKQPFKAQLYAIALLHTALLVALLFPDARQAIFDAGEEMLRNL